MSKAREFWAPHAAASGKSVEEVSAYAREHGLNERTLRWWRSRLRREASALPKVAAAATSRFVAVRVMPGQTEDASIPATLRLGGVLSIELSALPSPHWLAELGRALQESR